MNKTQSFMQLKHKDILVVEDNPSLRMFYKQSLKGVGASVLAFESANEALDYLHQAKKLPDLIFLDLILPDMTGEEFMFYLRADAELKGIQVIVCSGKEGVAKISKDIGANGFLKKPLTAEALIRFLY